jgi:hypothetical protein
MWSRPDCPSFALSVTLTGLVVAQPAQEPPSHAIVVAGAAESMLTVNAVSGELVPAPLTAWMFWPEPGSAAEPVKL